MIDIDYIGWTEGNEDKVVIFVNLPHTPINPDSLFEDSILMLSGRRTGKLRAKKLSTIDSWAIRATHTQDTKYRKCFIENRKLKHLLPQIEKHYTWALLST